LTGIDELVAFVNLKWLGNICGEARVQRPLRTGLSPSRPRREPLLAIWFSVMSTR
jgi:hypothetical protein